MTVAPVSQTVELSAPSYLQQAGTNPDNLISESFRTNFMEVIFSDNQNFFDSADAFPFSDMFLASNNYDNLKGGFTSKVNNEMEVSREKNMMDMARVYVKATKQHSINSIISGISQRFGNSINQLVRGQ